MYRFVQICVGSQNCVCVCVCVHMHVCFCVCVQVYVTVTLPLPEENNMFAFPLQFDTTAANYQGQLLNEMGKHISIKWHQCLLGNLVFVLDLKVFQFLPLASKLFLFVVVKECSSPETFSVSLSQKI